MTGSVAGPKGGLDIGRESVVADEIASGEGEAGYHRAVVAAVFWGGQEQANSGGGSNLR